MRDESSPAPSESGGDSDSQKLMKLFQSLVTGMSKASSGGFDTLNDKGRRVDNVPAYRDGTEMSKYLRGFEADMRCIGVSKDNYKSILQSKLSPKVREKVVELIDDDHCTYDRLKCKLVESVGLSKRDLEIKLFEDFEADVRHMDREARWRHVKSLTDRAMMMFPEKYDLALFMAKGLYRVGLPASDQGVIDSRKITRFSDMSEVAATLKTTNTRSKEFNRSAKREGYLVPKCYRCQGYGHKSYECRQRSDEGVTKIVCYNCNQPGHKSPDCPKNKNSVKDAKSSCSGASSSKYSSSKSSEKTRNCDLVASYDVSRALDGKINGHDCKVVVDTGADISVVPSSLVNDSQLFPETIEINGVTVGKWATINTAATRFEFYMAGQLLAQFSSVG